MAPATRRVGDDADFYAVAKRRVNKRLPVLATGAYRVAQSGRSLLFHDRIHLDNGQHPH